MFHVTIIYPPPRTDRAHLKIVISWEESQSDVVDMAYLKKSKPIISTLTDHNDENSQNIFVS